LNQKENTAAKKHKKTEQCNNVEHKEITSKDKKTGKTKHIFIVSYHYGLPDSIGKGS